MGDFKNVFKSLRLKSGLTQQQIANNLGISIDTLIENKKKYSEFNDALKKGKEVIDFEVENALLKRALGYEYEEETYENGILTKKVKKQVPPDTTAQIFWLKNRKPNNWKDRVETDEDKEEAEARLAKYQCEYNYGELQNTYYVTEYGLEYCDCDEDGEWEAGSDFDLAEETTKK